MPTPLQNRFLDALHAASFGDAEVYLSNEEREELERGGAFKEVAREKLPRIERALWWAQATSVAALVLLVASALLTTLAHTGTALTTTPFANAFSIVLWPVLFSLAAAFNLWRAVRLTQKRLLCEVILETGGGSR